MTMTANHVFRFLILQCTMNDWLDISTKRKGKHLCQCSQCHGSTALICTGTLQMSLFLPITDAINFMLATSSIMMLPLLTRLPADTGLQWTLSDVVTVLCWWWPQMHNFPRVSKKMWIIGPFMVTFNVMIGAYSINVNNTSSMPYYIELPALLKIEYLYMLMLPLCFTVIHRWYEQRAHQWNKKSDVLWVSHVRNDYHITILCKRR